MKYLFYYCLLATTLTLTAYSQDNGLNLQVKDLSGQKIDSLDQSSLGEISPEQQKMILKKLEAYKNYQKDAHKMLEQIDEENF